MIGLLCEANTKCENEAAIRRRGRGDIIAQGNTPPPSLYRAQSLAAFQRDSVTVAARERDRLQQAMDVAAGGRKTKKYKKIKNKKTKNKKIKNKKTKNKKNKKAKNKKTRKH